MKQARRRPAAAVVRGKAGGGGTTVGIACSPDHGVKADGVRDREVTAIPMPRNEATLVCIKRFGSPGVSCATPDGGGEFGKRLIREMEAALASGRRMDEAAFERDLSAGLLVNVVL